MTKLKASDSPCRSHKVAPVIEGIAYGMLNVNNLRKEVRTHMDSDQRTYQVSVEALRVDRNDLGPLERVAAVVNGRWPKVLLHKIACPCCGKTTFHRPGTKSKT